MYRAKVEQISGARVKANGKWLRCIGNKNVNVGDYVFTDGRCVYGYDKESMTPFVPTPTKEEIGIPIIFIRDFYTYYKNDFFNSGESSNSKITQLTNNKNSVFVSDNPKIVASNVDNFDNVYYILLDEDKIKIVKNSKIVMSYDVPIKEKDEWIVEDTNYEVIRNEALLHFDAVPVDDFSVENLYTKYFRGIEIKRTETSTAVSNHYEESINYCDWAYIKDDKEWALVITNFTNIETITPYATAKHLLYADWFNGTAEFGQIPLSHLTKQLTLTTHLIRYDDNNINSRVLFNANQHWDAWEGQTGEDQTNEALLKIAGWIGVPVTHFEYRTQTTPFSYNHAEFSNINFPIHDNGYFVVDNVSIKSKYLEDFYNSFSSLYPYSAVHIILEDYYSFTVYDKKSEKVTSYETVGFPNVIASYIGTSETLLIINNHLARLSKKEETLQIETYSTPNRCLRPMKKYKNWWKRTNNLEGD